MKLELEHQDIFGKTFIYTVYTCWLVSGHEQHEGACIFTIAFNVSIFKLQTK
jgi:hypothetical protein